MKGLFRLFLSQSLVLDCLGDRFKPEVIGGDETVD